MTPNLLPFPARATARGGPEDQGSEFGGPRELLTYFAPLGRHVLRSVPAIGIVVLQPICVKSWIGGAPECHGRTTTEPSALANAEVHLRAAAGCVDAHGDTVR